MTIRNSPGKKLNDLIATGETILIPGAHDPLMGRLLQRMGFKVLAVAGWMTGAHLVTPEPVMTMTEQVAVARAVAKVVDLPIVADAGTGYGDPIQVMRAVREFEDAGIASGWSGRSHVSDRENRGSARDTAPSRLRFLASRRRSHRLRNTQGHSFPSRRVG